ncbi:MAG: leucine-rich repeat protein, partial [Clostridia bacterium]|nr:leucine-rich repeat protein [Clostridia bacterium]
MQRIDIEQKDVFISWTGTDAAIKDTVAAHLEAHGLSVLLSDRECQGDFVTWSRSAATSAHIFLTVITERALNSAGMRWELEEIDRKLRSEEGEFWKDALIPVCESLALWEAYRKGFSPEGQAMLETLSAVVMEKDENGALTARCLEEIREKTEKRIVSHMLTLYREKTKPDYIKLIPLCDEDAADAAHPFEALYVSRKITEIDGNKQEIETHATPKVLCTGENVSFVYGPAGCGKSQYIHQIRGCVKETDVVISLSCADVSADGRGLLPIMYDEFRKICGNKYFYREANFNRLLTSRRLILVLDGMDEITTKDATRAFAEKVAEYYRANADSTALIFTGRNEKDADILLFGGAPVRRFRLDPLTEEEIGQLSNNLFLAFREEEKGQAFFVSIKDLGEEIRSNPLLLSQLAIVYRESGNVPKTVVGILDAISRITLRADGARHRNLQAIPARYLDMVKHDIGAILKSFSKEKYEKAAQGRQLESSRIFRHILKERYGESGEESGQRTEFLLEYLRNRAIFADGKFYHKMFLEYFAAVAYYEKCFDEDYGEIDDPDAITELFRHYGEDYWREVLQLFLVKADSCIDGESTEALYRLILSEDRITEYTLLFDVCRELIVHKQEASLVLAEDILEKSVNGTYPPYGPLFWYIPEYGQYESAVLAAERLAGNARALALVRDVCVIFGRKYTVADVTDKVEGAQLFTAAERGLSGVRRGLVELFCTGATDTSLGADIYPRCFNIAETKSLAENGCGLFGRMETLFEDELGLWKAEDYPELGGEYLGFVSCPYDKAVMEQTLQAKPTNKVRGLALSNTDDTVMDYVQFVRTSVRVMYVPENVTDYEEDYDLFMPLESLVRVVEDAHLYMPRDVRKIRVPESWVEINGNAFKDCTSLSSITIPESVTKIGRSAFEGCTSLSSITIPEGVTKIGRSAFKGCTSLSSITIPESVTEIGWFAFEGCTGLSSITIPESVREIVWRVFEGCTSLSSITIPESVTEIDLSAFAGCTSLSSITIPESV